MKEIPTIYILALITILIAVSLGTYFYFSERLRKKKLREYKYFVQTATAAIRSKDILNTLSNSWDRFKTTQSMLQKITWTDKELLDGLENLFSEAVEEDKEKGRSGRDSNYFDFYDCGFASHCEALRDRLGLPQPWSNRKT